MRGARRGTIGLLLLAGSILFSLCLLVAEALYPGYSVSDNTISALGAGPFPSNLIFNGSVFLFGAGGILIAVLLYRWEGQKELAAVLMAAGIGAMGVGVFTAEQPFQHNIAASLAFTGGALAAILSYRIVGSAAGLMGGALGMVSLIALGLYITGNYIGLGEGGMERMGLYPFLLWFIAAGGMLLKDGQLSEPIR